MGERWLRIPFATSKESHELMDRDDTPDDLRIGRVSGGGSGYHFVVVAETREADEELQEFFEEHSDEFPEMGPYIPYRSGLGDIDFEMDGWTM